MTERNKVFDGRITLGNVLTMVALLIGGFWAFADNEAKDRIQDEKIAHTTILLERSIAETAKASEKAIEMERIARKEALQEVRIRAEADRAEMRAQFVKVNDKLDELIKQRSGK